MNVRMRRVLAVGVLCGVGAVGIERLAAVSPTAGVPGVQARPRVPPGTASPAQLPPGTAAPGAAGQARPGAPATAPARDAAAAPAAGTGAISGRVLTADGRPVRRATINVMGAGQSQGRMATTNADGRYEVRDLPAGRYSITATKGGYQGLSYGAREPGLSGKPVEIADKARVEGIDFVLQRGCVITGRVYDEYGEPAAEVNVAVSMERSIAGRRRPMQTSGRSTDDRGEFRFFNLRAGDYLVSATVRQVTTNATRGDGDREGYAPTYFPGTPSPAEAGRVRCALGQETTGIDFTLSTVRTVQVSGRVLDAQGRPASGHVMLAPGRLDLVGMVNSAPVRPDGTFSILNVVPGEYSLEATSTPAGPGSPREFAVQPLTVADADVSGLLLQLGSGARLSGRIIGEGELPAADRAKIRINVQPADADASPLSVGATGTTVRADGTFELSNIFGQVHVRAYGPSAEWRLKAVRVDGRDVTDAALDLRATQEVKDVEVVLTNRLSVLTATVQDDRGAPVADAMVLAFAEDAEQWRYPTRFVAVARASVPGDPFKISTLPPGRYLVAAVALDPWADIYDPALLERLRPDAERVTLREGETAGVTLKKLLQ